MPQEEQTYNIHYQAEEIETLLDKIHDLGNASSSEAGLMSSADKTKLDGIASGAQANVLEGVKLGDTALVPTEKVVTIPVDSTPTASSNNPISSGGVKTALDNLNAGVMTFAGNLVDTRSAGTRQSFAFRQSGGDGVNYMRKILGRTEAWNQMVNPETAEASKTENGITFTKNGDGSITVSGTATTQVTYLVGNYTLISGRKYLLSGCPMGGGADTYVLYLSDAGIAVNEYGGGVIATAVQTGPVRIRIVVPSGAVISAPVVFKPQLVDLTLEGLGLTTADQFRALHPLGYYSPNAGVLKNNAATGLETVGFNQWDEEWDNGRIDDTTGQNLNNYTSVRSKNYIPIIGGAVYYVRTDGNELVPCFYDSNKNFVGNGGSAYLHNRTITAPANASYMRFWLFEAYGTTYNHDICINLSDASRNGIYEPYWKREIVLGLDNLACHDENNNAVVVNGLDGVGTAQDELVVENGYVTKIIKRFAEVDMGSLSWTNTGSIFVSSSLNSLMKMPASYAAPSANGICDKYGKVGTYNDFYNKDKAIYTTWIDAPAGLGLRVNDSAYSDAATFKASMAGVKLRYELATPKVLTLDNPIPALIEVDSLGTEKRLPEDTADNPQAPFECDSNYSISTANLLRKLNS